MADETEQSNEKNRKSYDVEVRRDDQRQELRPTRELREVSVLSFIYKMRKRALQAYREATEAENGVLRAKAEQERLKARLKDVGREIELERLERENRLDDAKRKANLSKLDDQVEEKRRIRDLRKLEREIEALTPQEADGKSSPEPTKGQQIIRLNRKLEEELARLRKEGITEEDEKWKMIRNYYENEIRKVTSR